MKLSEVIYIINKTVEDMDLAKARSYIEEHLEELEQNKHLLKGNARELVNFFVERKNQGEKPLSRQELSDINAINLYAKRFDLRGLKLAVKNKKELFMKKEVINHLTKDSKTLLASIGVIERQ